MRHSRARRVRALLCLALAFSLAGCGWFGGSEGSSPDEPAGPPTVAWETAKRDDVREGGTLRLAVSALPASFNPFHAGAVGSEADKLLAPTAGGALRVTDDGGWEIDPLYAESVEVTDTDPFTVRVQLNPEAVWSDGEAVTADDMVAFASAQQAADGQEVGERRGWSQIESVEPADQGRAYTVRFKRPVADWPALIYPGLSAADSAGGSYDDFADSAPASLGPFVVDEIDREAQTVTLVRNRHWWGPAPKLERIVWRAAGIGAQAEAFAAGELDAVDVDSSTYAAVQRGGKVQRAAGREWSHLTLNSGRGPLESIDVRMAVAHGLDRDAIAEAAAEALGGDPVLQGSVVSVPGQAGYRDAASTALHHDPVLAREMLEQAGYRQVGGKAVGEDDEPLTLRMPVPADTPSISERADLIAGDLAEIGITVEIETVDPDAFFAESVVPLDFDLVTFRWSAAPFDVAAAEDRFFPIDSPQNFTGQGPDEVHDAWTKANAVVEAGPLADAVENVDRVVLEFMAMVPLAVEPVVVAVDKDVVNYGASQFVRPDWTRVGFRS